MNPRYLLIAVTATTLACQQKDSADDEAGAASQGSDSVQVTDDEASTLALALDGSDQAMKPLSATLTAEQVAANAGAHVGKLLQPASCHSASVVGATATYTFNDCTGPRGLVHLTGTLTVVYSVDASGIHAHATASDFNVNESTLDIDATATYVVTEAGKTLTVETHGEGTGPLGHTLTHEGSYTVTWTDTCHTLDGGWSTTANGTTRTTTVTDLTRCKGFCPAAGGTVTHTFKGGQTLTITFSGGASATWTLGTRMGTIQLTCTPAS